MMSVQTKDSNKTKENVAQEALNQTEFGLFNLKIFALSALVCINGGLALGNIGLILPAAACDFRMTTAAKGRVGMMPILGMLFGPYFWASVAEMRGRRIGIMAALILHGLGDFFASIVSSYWGLLICKFVVGFGFSGQLALIFTYLGEFQPCKYRDRLLTWLEFPWAVGLLVVAGLGWAILPLDFDYRIDSIGFFFKSWSLYLLVCSLLPPILAIYLFFLPETPKYLAETGQHAALLELLADIYHINTKCPREEYLEKMRKMGDPGIDEFIAKAQERNVIKQKTVIQMARQYYQQTKEIIKPPHLKTTILVATCSYTVVSPYFIMIFWLPEIFQRYSTFEKLFPGQGASICTISNILYSANATDKIEMDFSNCTNVLNPTVYFHNMVLGTTCIPVAFWLPLFIDRLGYKLHLVVASLSSAILAFGLYFVQTSTENLIVACLFEALASVCTTIVLCILVELYPTHLRVIAAALASFVGRLGSFVGITLVGYLIDDHCLLLILLIGAHLVVAGICGIFIPIRKSRAEFEKRQKSKKLESTANHMQLSS